MDEPQEQNAPPAPDPGPPPQRAVVCVDGLVSSILKPFTPDIGWSHYAAWLTQRRPDLTVVHLAQPHDWRDILSGKTEGYPGLVRMMLHDLLAQHPANWSEVVVLGYSLGGLTALNVAHELGQRVSGALQLKYLAFVTFGTPFGGTHAINDLLLRRMPISFLERIYERFDTLHYLRELVRGNFPERLRLLLHALERDELVSRDSALLPAEWLEFAEPETDVEWGQFDLNLGRFVFSPHGAFPQHARSLAYVDGMVDGLLPPPAGNDRRYEPIVLPPGAPG